MRLQNFKYNDSVFLSKAHSINQEKTETEKQAERENVLWGGYRKMRDREAKRERQSIDLVHSER